MERAFMEGDMSAINPLPLSSQFTFFACSVKLDLGPIIFFFPLPAHTKALSIKDTEQDLNYSDRQVWGRDM